MLNFSINEAERNIDNLFSLEVYNIKNYDCNENRLYFLNKILPLRK